ncbi:MAG: hypothetical protein WDN00_03515 [Limisphaerales bacterium]
MNDPLFNVETWRLDSGANALLKPKKLQIIAVTSGEIEIKSGSVTVYLSSGQFSLIPASLERTEVLAKSDSPCCASRRTDSFNDFRLAQKAAVNRPQSRRFAPFLRLSKREASGLRLLQHRFETGETL